MRAWVKPLLVCIVVFVAPLPAWSVIILTTEGKEYKGYLVSESQVKVVIRLPGVKEEKSFFRFDIAQIVQAVKPDELEKLKPDNPRQYYDEALKLVANQDDPEARDTAIRLFLIAAYLGPIDYGYVGLLKCADLARTGEEARAFRALAYLINVQSDKKVLEAGGKAEDLKAREAFLRTVELLRRGKTDQALKESKTKGVADFFNAIPGFMTYKEFEKFCNGHSECIVCNEGRIHCTKCSGKGIVQGATGLSYCSVCQGKTFTICTKCDGKPRRIKLSPRQINIIAQLQLQDELDPNSRLDNPPAEPNPTSWSALIIGPELPSVPILSLIHLTEFDPRQNVYKNGKWVAP